MTQHYQVEMTTQTETFGCLNPELNQEVGVCIIKVFDDKDEAKAFFELCTDFTGTINNNSAIGTVGITIDSFTRDDEGKKIPRSGGRMDYSEIFLEKK